MVKPQTFGTNYMSKVQPFFDLRNGKSKPYRFIIAHHSISYFSINGNRSSTVIRLNREGGYAYKWEDVVGLHSLNGIWVEELTKEHSNLLSKLTDKGMHGNILPKRKGQMFFGKRMDPFHCGMRTFFSTETCIGSGENDGVTQLLKPGFAVFADKEKEGEEGEQGTERSKKEKILKDLVTDIMNEGWERVYGKGSSENKAKDVLVTMACCLRQSRFCTASRERVAPLVEMSFQQQKQMKDKGGVCVHALVPLSTDGLIVRFFYNRDDKNGTLIKVMPDTILYFPSTAIMEYGRLTNIDGHRHLLIKILFTKGNGGQPAIDMSGSVREYPHLDATMNEMMEANEGKMPDDWEREFRFVTYPRLNDIPKKKVCWDSWRVKRVQKWMICMQSKKTGRK
jgi:hypothetical protein